MVRKKTKGTNPLNPTNNLPDDLLADCDGDYLPNYWEILYGFDPAVKDDLTQDTDRDGLTPWNEYRVGTNPNKWNSDGQGPGDYEEQFIDTDGDTLPDYYEERFGLDPNIPDDIAQDSDGDGLTLWQEYKAHTDPNHQDTDRDGITDDLEAQADTDSDQLPDIYELWYDLNLSNPDDAALDKDKDGLTNLQEFQAGTFPNDRDTDNDGYIDGGEVDCAMNPLEALSSEHTLDCDNDGMTNGYEASYWFLNPFDDADAQADWDKDTLVNLDEYTLGTDPSNWDTDGDLLKDGGEVACGLDPTNALPSERIPDCDGDSLSNGYEVDNNLDPFNPSDSLDSDDDGLNNLEEFNLGTDPQNPDTDNDGLRDGGEVDCGLAPLNAIPSEQTGDCDNDTIPNGYEAEHSLDPFDGSDTSLDPDKDGLTNLEEYHDYETDPQNPDSDGDGLIDGGEVDCGLDPANDLPAELAGDCDGDGMLNGYEATYNLNPFNPDDANLDYDNDGLTNLEEHGYNTNPRNFDTDGDLLPDNWEIDHAFDPTDPTGDNGATGDPDNDGLDNFGEYLNETDPHNPDTDGDCQGASARAARMSSQGNPNCEDGGEVDNGGDPNDPSDGGEPPDPKTIVEVEFTVGDHSGSESERYKMNIKGVEGDTRSLSFASRSYGKVDTKTYKLKIGSAYEVSIHHLGTNLEDGPDYDYTANVVAKDGYACLPIEDSHGILGSHNESDSFFARGKVAKVYVPTVEFPITINTFIPANNINNPIPFSGTTFGGDDRGFDKNGPFRTQQNLILITCEALASDGLKDDSHVPATGLSTEYEKATSLSGGVLTSEAKSDWIKGAPLKVDWDTASTSGIKVTPSRLSKWKIKAVCSVSVANPLMLVAPKIDYKFTITIDSSDFLKPTFSINGPHDGYPAYEVYIKDQKIYGYHPGTTKDPWSLWGDGDENADESGEIE